MIEVIRKVKKNLMSISGAVWITVATVLFFVYGKAYNDGYWSTLSISIQKMDNDFHTHVYNGFIFSFSYFILFAGTLFLLSYVFVFLVYVRFSDVPDLSANNINRIADARKYIESMKLIKKYSGLKALKFFYYQKLGFKRKIGRRETTSVEKIAYYTLAITFAILVLLIVLFSTAYRAEKEGVSKANRVLDQYLNNTAPIISYISLETKKYPNKLFFLGCGKSNCAGIDPSMGQMHIFPSSLSYSFMFKKPKKLKQ